VYCLARTQNDRGCPAATGHLAPLTGLAGRRLAVAVLPALLLAVAVAAEQPQAAESVAVKPDGRPRIDQVSA
jgi:hypothetical protein